jgi:hypothetical protein
MFLRVEFMFKNVSLCKPNPNFLNSLKNTLSHSELTLQIFQLTAFSLRTSSPGPLLPAQRGIRNIAVNLRSRNKVWQGGSIKANTF